MANYVVSDDLLEDLIFRFTRDITAMVRKGKFDPIIGREEEINHLELILLQRLRKNAMLIGPAGVGKSALFVGLAHKIVSDNVPRLLKDARVLELDLTSMAAGAKERSEFEGRLIPFIRGIAERNDAHEMPPIIICIDEFHTIMPTCKASSAAGIVDIMKSYLTMGNLYVVGTTTRNEYQDYVTPDQAVVRRFQLIELEQPNQQETLVILQGIRDNFIKHYNIAIPDDVCRKIVWLTAHFMRHRTFPDKAILTLDAACARAIQAGIKDGDTLPSRMVVEAVAAEINLNPDAVEEKAAEILPLGSN
ncbi:MAG: ATP-dependent Clp protease ATP-binding subunit [Alphaproteobacteria bacterium]|nr:MAG: ATP-dependent Clp protease ATP-binding subunit [Alphaproteobacteria bacterium]